MAHLLIWGVTHEILSEGRPRAPRQRRLRSLAALQAVLDGRVAGAMVLADPRWPRGRARGDEAWLRNGGARAGFSSWRWPISARETTF